MKKNRKVKIKKGRIILVLVLLISLGYLIFSLFNREKIVSVFLASNEKMVSIYDEERNILKELPRGREVSLYENYDDSEYSKIKIDNEIYYVLKNNISSTYEESVMEKEIYVRTSYNLNKDVDTEKLLDLVVKGEKLDVIGFDKILDDGTVNMYKVSYNDKEGYFYSKYASLTKEEALIDYDFNGALSVHQKQKDVYGGGDGASLDYYPVIKPKFTDNVMPDNVNALYLDCTKQTISNVDSFIEFAKTTKINAFVVDILDDTCVGYASEFLKTNSPTTYKYAQNSVESYQEAIKKIKDNGFYVIGRITAFKDTYYVSDHKENAISDKKGNPLKHQTSYWPTAFSRDVWEYDVLFAKEAVELMGFNEIQFDYVRFPDGLRSKEKNGEVDYHNKYKETKAQAVQRFLMYACNELHKLGVYVSADVFGESSYGSGYVTSYGQYWPAISTVVDVISAMPYTDHFGKDYGKHNEPWLYPYDTVNTWAKTASNGQKLSASPAIARTWITAYNTPVASSGTKKSYNSSEVESQIKALYDNGLNGGYMTWNAYTYNNKINKYKLQKDAYSKEYGNEENNS